MTKLLIRLFIRDGEDGQKKQAYGTLAGITGICCNGLLFAVKIAIGVLTGAISVVADALNNLSDAASSVITLVGFRMAGKPADPDHPFGHGRMEYLAGLFVAVAILLMGLELLKSSVEEIFRPKEPSVSVAAVVLLLLSIGVKLWMGMFYRYTARASGSETLTAAATDSFSDCIATGAVAAGFVLYMAFHVNVDGWIGCGVSFVVLAAGIQAARDTIQPILGQAPDKQLVEDITREVCSHREILGIHDLIVHDYGLGRRMISLHGEVNYHGDLMVLHDAIDHIERDLKEKFHCEAVIHMDPVVTDDERLNAMHREVEELVRGCDERWSIHDFRMASGRHRSRIQFDLVVPMEQLAEKEQIRRQVEDLIREKHSRVDVDVTVEQSYT